MQFRHDFAACAARIAKTLRTCRLGRLAWLAAFVAPAAWAHNPIAPGTGFTDPHVVIYGDRAYAYATHDASPDAKSFVMTDWWVWASDDLVKWRQVGTLRPEDTFLKRPFKDCWAGFGASRHGHYYWYFSAGPTEIGVVEGDSPTGPWRDPLGRPLIPRGLTPTAQRDPDILIDDDGTAYLVYGTFHYYVARLNDDMVSLAEAPRPIQLDRQFGPYGEGKTDDKPSLHKRNGLYYLSWSSFYAVSRSVYGPYSYRGSVISRDTTAPQFRMDDGRNGGLWHDRHGNFFTWHNQWFYICNDKSQPGRTTWFRDACISYVHYRDNGDIAPVRLDATGVGEYDARADRIEAEDYFAAKDCEVRETIDGGFEVRGLHVGSFLRFPRVRGLMRHATVRFRVAAKSTAPCTLQLREGGVDGPVLGQCRVPPEKSGYQIVPCTLTNAPGILDLWITATGGAGAGARLDWFAFNSPSRHAPPNG